MRAARASRSHWLASRVLGAAHGVGNGAERQGRDQRERVCFTSASPVLRADHGSGKSRRRQRHDLQQRATFESETTGRSAHMAPVAWRTAMIPKIANRP
jgi:hypothetical protein